MNAPVALGILKALDPTRQGEANSLPSPQANSGEKSQTFDNGQWDREKETAGKKERRGFWGGAREGALWKDWSKGGDQKDDAELTRMIGKKYWHFNIGLLHWPSIRVSDCHSLRGLDLGP